MANQMKGTTVNFTGISVFIKILGLIEIVRYTNPKRSCISFKRCIQRFQKWLWHFFANICIQIYKFVGN